jgi:distribution and morphology protein 34
MLAAKHGLVVPMLLRLSQFKLNSYVVLVVSKQKGITLVFKTDPLQSVDIHSTFDSVAVIQKFIQREIEGQLRQMFREDLPGIIHRLSQQWVKTTVDASYLSRTVDPPTAPPPTPISITHPLSFRELPSRGHDRQSPIATSRSSPHSSIAGSVLGKDEHKISVVGEPLDHLSFPDLEGFDPTYGLRHGGGPPGGSFSGLGRLYHKSRGLADLAEELDDTDESLAFDASVWDDSVSQAGRSHDGIGVDRQQYEVTPAVGGGIISRPRVVHSQSQSSSTHHSPPYSSLASPLATPVLGLPSIASSVTRPTLGIRTSSAVSNPYFPRVPSDLSIKTSSTSLSGRSYLPTHLSPLAHPRPPRARSSTATAAHGHDTIPTPPSSDAASANDETIRRKIARRPSLSSLATDDLGFPDLQQVQEPGPSRIILRPALSNPVSQFSILSHSNHTLSPFTRSMEHFAVRSGPPRTTPLSRSAALPERVPQKGRRKRIYRLGGSKPEQGSPASPPLSDVGSDDMNHYFR